MPFALVFVGLLLIVTGFQDTYKQLGTQVQEDFSGQGNFIYWLLSIGIVGSFGYVKEFQTVSRAFLALIIVAMFLSNKSGVAQGITFFSNLTSGVQSGTASSVNSVGADLPAPSGSSSSSTSGSSSDIIPIATTAPSFFTTAASFFGL